MFSMLKWCLFAAVTAHLSALAFGLPVAGEDVPDDSIGVRISQASVHVPGSPADTVGSFGTQYHNKQNMSPEQHASYEAIREIVQRARHDGLVEDDFLDVSRLPEPLQREIVNHLDRINGDPTDRAKHVWAEVEYF